MHGGIGSRKSRRGLIDEAATSTWAASVSTSPAASETVLGRLASRTKEIVSARHMELIAVVALGVAFLVARSVFLDRDQPPFGVSQLQPIDEFFYTIPAFNFFHYGSLTHQVATYVPSDGSPLNFFENFVTWLTLAAFGNNYFGLRMASVLAGLGVFLLLFVIVRPQRPAAAEPIDDSWLRTIGLLWVGYLLFDFAFTVSARVAEPTIFRMFAMVALIAVASIWTRKRPGFERPFALGLLATAACLFVYIYNAFLIPAILLALLVDGLRDGPKQAAREVAAGLAGCVVAVAIYAVVVYATYGQSLAQVYGLYVSPMGHHLIPTDARVLLTNFYSIAGTNLFRFNIPLLVVFLVALPVFAYRIWSERRGTGVLVGGLVFFLVLQSEFVTDYPLKKLAMLSPLVIIVIVMAQGYARPFLARVKRAAVLFILATLIYGFAAAWVVYKVYTRTAGARVGSLADLNVLGLIVIAAVVLIAVVARGRRELALTTFLIAALALPGVYLQMHHLYLHPTFRYRDAMIAAAPILDGKTTAGGISIAFRLYNTSTPVMNPYQYELVPGGMTSYYQKLQRLFADGIAQYLVAGNPDNLDLIEVARYRVDVVNYPYFVIYKHR
jgi:hypothetical protein